MAIAQKFDADARPIPQIAQADEEVLRQQTQQEPPRQQRSGENKVPPAEGPAAMD